MASCVRTVHEQRRAHTLLRALCCSERASTASVGRPVERCDGATADVLFTFAVQKSTPPLHRAKTKEVSTASAPGCAASSPLPRPRSLRCALHTSTRVHSTLDMHAPRVRAHTSRAHALTRQHALTSKAWLLPCSSHWPLADRRPARRWHIWLTHALQTRSPSPLRAIPMHRRHAVHAIHLHRCTLPPYGRET